MLTDAQIDDAAPTDSEHKHWFTQGAKWAEAAATTPLLATIARQDKILRFIERWANHHGAKPHMTPQEALACIQHYPDVEAITKSYADGKVPETPNPWARIKELEAALEARLQGSERMSETIATLERRLAQQQDAAPVAWRVRRYDAPKYWIVFLHKPVDALKDPERQVEPLYTHSAATQKTLAPKEFLSLAESCGAVLTGTPDGKKVVTIVFTVDAWRRFAVVSGVTGETNEQS